jgi:ketosteroid isomerase-like protein
MSKIESAIRVVLEFNEAFNRHDVVGMMRLMSEDCVLESIIRFPKAQCLRGRK